MSDTNDQQDVQSAKDEAVDNVVDRVESYNDGAEKGTVESELRQGFEQAGVDVDGKDVSELADQIHRDGQADTDQVDPA